MITRLNPIFNNSGQLLDFHSITKASTDVSTQVISWTVGSWGSEAISRTQHPDVERLIQIKYLEWLPEYQSEAKTIIQAHPDWSGEGLQRPNQNHVYVLPEGVWKDLRPLVSVQAAQWNKIQTIRDKLKLSGTRVEDFWFHSDANSRTQQLGLVLLGANIPADLQWKTMSGRFVTMTSALAQQVFTATAFSDQAIFAKAEEHKAAMQAAINPEDYDFTVGWPATYLASSD